MPSGIAEELSLSLQTVRTILNKDAYLDRGSRRILQRIAPDHLREKVYQTKKARRRTLQKQINTWPLLHEPLQIDEGLGPSRKPSAAAVAEVRQLAVSLSAKLPMAKGSGDLRATMASGFG